MTQNGMLKSLWLWMLFLVVGNVSAQVARIDGVYYGSLQDAIDYAPSGATITLHGNITENVTVAAGKNVIVDLNGHNITVAAAKPAFTNFGTLKIQGEGNVTRSDNRGYVIDNQGTIELAGGNYKKTAGTSMNALLRNAGTMTISGGTYYAKYGNSAGTLDDTRADNIYSANSVGMPEGTVSTVSMTGGEFLTTTNGFVATATSSCEVTGGTFATAPHKFFAEGYGVEKNAEGKYVTSDGYILSDGTNYYKTVADAYTTATKALSLIADYEGNIEIPAAATNNYLYLNNHKVTGNITNNAEKALTLGESSTAKTTSENGIVTGTLSDNIQVIGGKYVNDPVAKVNKYEYKTQQTSGYYVVVDKTAEEKAAALAADGIKVTTSSGYYPSVQAAWDAAAATNYTITLVADIENENVTRTKTSANRNIKLEAHNFSGSIDTDLNGTLTGVRFSGTGNATLENLTATFLTVDNGDTPNVTVKAGTVTGNVTAKVGYLTIEGGTFTATGTSALAGTEGHLIIKGGTFAVDPTNFIAEGYEVITNDNGTFTVQETVLAIAQIGDVKYETLAEAIAAVPTDGTATTITMLADAELTAAVAIALGKNVVLDLNGHNITSTVTAISNKGNLEVTGTGNITVTGTSKTAYGISNSGGAALANRANLVVGENVTITAPCTAIYTSYAYTTVNGTLANTQAETSSNLYSTLRQSNGSEVIVAATAKVTGQVNAIYGNYGTVEVNSTNVVGKIYADGSATQGLKIKKTAAIEELNVYGHAECSDVADYYVAAKAISGCTGTVKLLSDINAALALSAGKTVTLDLNGHKVTAETYPIKVEGKLTITGEGTLQSTGMGSSTSVQAAAYVLKDGQLTILSGNYVAGFEGAEGNPAVYVRDNAVVEIQGGDFVGGSKFLLNKLDASQATSTIEVTGGTFHNNFNPADNTAEGEHTNFVAEGYVAVDNGDGSWTVREDIEFTVYTGNNVTGETMKISEFIEAQKAQPNAMAVVSSANAEKVEGLTNVIVDYAVGKNGHYYECENFVLTDLENWFSPVNFTAISGSYSRSLADSGLNSVCMPFALSADNTPSGSKLYVYHSTDMDEANAYFNTYSSIEAGRPCLMDNATGIWNVEFDNTEISATPSVSALVGSFAKRTIGVGYYKASNGSLAKTTSSSTVSPFRCYLDLSHDMDLSEGSANAKSRLNIVFGDSSDATGIAGVSADENEAIYDVNGVQRNVLGKGINIIRTKDGAVRKIFNK